MGCRTFSTGASDSTSNLKMGSISGGMRRVRDSILSKERSRKDLRIGIAGFYDRSSKLWEDVWGEHMHHGYYIPEDRTDHVQAQIDLIDEVLKWGDVTKATSVVDVGCGIGGSSRHIAKKFGCEAQGITLSPYQSARGNELAKEQGLSDRVSFQVADALDMPFEDNSFDLVWSLESGEVGLFRQEEFESILYQLSNFLCGASASSSLYFSSEEETVVCVVINFNLSTMR